MQTPSPLGSFPQSRLRRLRRWSWSRAMVRETQLTPSHLIWPIFVKEGTASAEPIASMPGVERISVDLAVQQAVQAVDLGISCIAIFPVTPPDLKSDDGRHALDPSNLICRATQAVRQRCGDSLGIVCDVALDPYTTHGHDGILIDNDVANDPTVDILCVQAINQARAGCSVIAPSDMMDGRVGRIRQALDEEGFSDVAIMSYAAKYASAFYGPFRDAVGSAKNLGRATKKTYQMDPANTDEALRETAFDIEEGADMVMVKPGMPYLDIVRRLSDHFPVPIAVYQVSGEYAMLKRAAEAGALDEQAAVMESMIAFRRAGACGILTYFAKQVAQWLQ